MTEDRLIKLLVRQACGEEDTADRQELERLAADNPAVRALLNRMNEPSVFLQEMDDFAEGDPVQGFVRWRARRAWLRKVVKLNSWMAAAVLLLAVTTGIFLGIRKKHSIEAVAVGPHPTLETLILPGRNTAVLTLANGREILLDTAGKGEITRQGSSRVVKADTAQLIYLPAVADIPRSPLLYNTLTTPRSGQYQVRFPDGSRVWLNNASKLRYPTEFADNNRTVELTGEGYFEIVGDAARPFMVQTANEKVVVLGTSFNIKSYPEDGGTSTTLIAGRVRVKMGKTAVVLQPGEQARADSGGRLIVEKNVPGEDIASWKDGYFYFGRDNVPDVMRQLARWYDVEVVYKGKIAKEVYFDGKPNRNMPLNKLIKFFFGNGIDCHLEGRRLIVSSN